MAFAQTEPGARYELARVSTRATPSGDGWVLEGDKRAVLHGGCADLLVVSARTAGAEGDAHGISVFLVERGAPGVTVSEYRGLDNLRLADVRLAGVRVARAGLLGAEGGGWSLIEEVVDYATALVCAEAVGAIKWTISRRGASSACPSAPSRRCSTAWSTSSSPTSRRARSRAWRA